LGVRSLPDKIPENRKFVFSENAGIDKDTFDIVLVADFNSANDYLIYRDHPHHTIVLFSTKHKVP